MSLIQAALQMGERVAWPDVLSRAVIERLVARSARALAQQDGSAERDFAAAMATLPVALSADVANRQHYELPAAFFTRVLGPRTKYSCCLFGGSISTLADAETRALEETVHHADLADGQTILDLGCGWGAVSLYAAERFAGAEITAVSNSHAQRAFIEHKASLRGLKNIRVLTADMNSFSPNRQFDRVVSVEMFEHIANWRALLVRIRDWLAPHGRLFLHVFSHAKVPYRFDETNSADWIGQHFFTGGIMPSHGLVGYFSDIFDVEAQWRWDGQHYRLTAEHWLANFDRHTPEIAAIFRQVYGPDASLWIRRWRLFFLSVAELFGHADGSAWGVSHYRLQSRCAIVE